MPKRVAIVGAGVSGLTSIKCCLDEGLEPTCFEKSDDIGGLWRFTEHVEEGRASLYKSVVSNTCKEMSAFTDFPYPEDFPVFLSHTKLQEYLQMYTKRFDLRKHIQFQATVVSIRKRPDFSATGQWDVITETNGKQKSAIFDAVMVCIGYLTEPSLPLSSFPGIDKFKGQYFHSRDYKSPELFRDKRVLVVGMGNSGVDIAVEASHIAKKVMISTGRGAWVISRVFDHGYPWDMVFVTRFMNVVRNSLPSRAAGWLVAHRVNQWFDHTNYGMVPEDSSVLREPVLNDELPGCIITGKVSIRPGVKEFKENSVVFKNTPPGEEEVDVIVFATGYKASFPFIDESIIKVENKHASLYKYIFPPQLEKPTLAMIGYIKPFGAVMPVVENQARWVTRVFKGLCKLPPVNTMMEEINEKKKNNWFGLSYDEVLKTDCIVYVDEIASFIGTKPSVPALLLQDPELAFKIFFGPCTGYQYRLTGPGKWDGARSAILSQWERTMKPTRTRVRTSQTPETMVRRVAIIGAGASGLASIKCCLDEGLEPTCFEKNDSIGGIWQFTETPEEGRVTVYRSVISNTSKEMTCFSDFPFPADFPNYLRHSKLLDYLRAYAENFHLLDYIHLKTIVCSVRKQPDFTATGQWLVVTETNGQQTAAVFDAIMVCSGFAELNLPLDSFPGIENFKGRYLHSWEYRDQKLFEGGKVLVVGSGNSGGDIAVEISRTGAQVFLSTRTGTWVMSRISDAGWPLDMIFTTRFSRSIERILPTCILNKILAKKFGQWFNHENYGLIPVESSWKPLIVNDELPIYILYGALVVKPNVKAFTETSAIFEDGTVEENIDVVIFATGYKASFPFLEESVRNVCKSRMNLYKHVFPPHLEKPTLAVIGNITATGSILAIAELQARWVTRVFNGSSKLPPVSKRISEIAKRKKDRLKQGIPIERDRVMANFINYMDEIAVCIGVKPNIPLLFLSDPKLALEVVFGPCTPYQYRLTGPGKWKEARSAILTQWNRVLTPLRTRVIDGSPKCFMASCLVKLLGLTAFLGAALLVFRYSSPSWLPKLW